MSEISLRLECSRPPSWYVVLDSRIAPRKFLQKLEMMVGPVWISWPFGTKSFPVPSHLVPPRPNLPIVTLARTFCVLPIHLLQRSYTTTLSSTCCCDNFGTRASLCLL